MDKIEDRSYGVIPLSKRDGIWKVFLILHQKGSHWAFPKGHKEDDESPLEAATRELKEETNLDVDRLLIPEPFIEKYQFYRKHQVVEKTVDYFVAEVSGEIILQGEEIREGKWLTLEEAMAQLTFKEARSICQKVILFLGL